MGPLQVFRKSCITDRRVRQYCLAIMINGNPEVGILFGKYCVSITLRWLNIYSTDIVWQGPTYDMWISFLPPFGRSSGCMTRVHNVDNL
jgi:hypothetical protein